MIDLAKDTFAHLAISANKFRNVSFRKDMPKPKVAPVQPRYIVPEKKKEFMKALVEDELTDDKSLGMKPVEIKEEPEYETVEHVQYRKEIEFLNNELRNLENIFKNLQQKESNVDLLLRVNSKIDQLKKVIAEKSAEL